jgi:hypothetical protein
VQSGFSNSAALRRLPSIQAAEFENNALPKIVASASKMDVPKAPWTAAARRGLEVMPLSSSSPLFQGGVEFVN